MKNFLMLLNLLAYAALVSFVVGLGTAWLYHAPKPFEVEAILALCFGLLAILMTGHMDLVNPSVRRFKDWM
jgi:hypothetical protein